MTRKSGASPLVVRAARASDADALTAFRCSTGVWYEDEVEDYVRNKILPRALESPTNLRLLLAFEEDRLVACGAHRPEGLMRDNGTIFLAVRLQLIAFSLDDQGRRDGTGGRLSDQMMKTVLADILDGGLSKVITALVARDNARSIALCERNGLRSQIAVDPIHVRLTGNFSSDN